MIVDRIFDWARRQPHKTALIDNEVACSYAEFAGRIDAARTYFQGQSLRGGTSALIFMPLSTEAWVYLLALRSLGVTTACASDWQTVTRIPWRDFAWIVANQKYQSRIPGSRDAIAQAQVLVVPEWPLSGLDVPVRAISPCESGSHMLFTSGTTGTLKAVLVSGAIEDIRNPARGKSMLLDHNSVLNNLDYPMWTGAGHKDPLAIWHLGATVIFDQSTARLTKIFDHQTTRIFLTPQCLEAAIDLFQGRDEEVVDRRCIISISSGPVSMNAMSGALETLSRHIVTDWSATEIMTFPLTNRVKEIDDMFWLGVANDRTVQVVDESGMECPVGVEGELRIQTMEMDCTSYLSDPRSTATHFREGFFYPGDLAVRRADGKYRILGRINDVLIMGGTKLPIAPLEQRVQKLLGVDNVCLFTGQNTKGYEELVIVLEADRLPSRDLLNNVARSFDSFERVRFEVLKKFPRTEMGMQKIRRADIRKLVGNSAATG